MTAVVATGRPQARWIIAGVFTSQIPLVVDHESRPGRSTRVPDRRTGQGSFRRQLRARDGEC